MKTLGVLISTSPVVTASVLQLFKEYLPLTHSSFYLLTTIIITVGTFMLFWIIWSVSGWILLFDIVFAMMLAIAYFQTKNDERRLLRLIEEHTQNGVFSIYKEDLSLISYPWILEVKKEIALLKNKGLISEKVSYYD